MMLKFNIPTRTAHKRYFDMTMTYNSEGHLILDIARGKYRIHSFLLLTAAYYFHAISPTPTGKDFNIVTIICILWAITLLWRSFFSQPLIFDTHQKCIFRGHHLVTCSASIIFAGLTTTILTGFTVTFLGSVFFR